MKQPLASYLSVFSGVRCQVHSSRSMLGSGTGDPDLPRTALRAEQG